MNGTMRKEIVDTQGAAEYLMVSPQMIQRLATAGQIGAKIGRLWRFRISELEAYVSSKRGAGNGQIQAGNS